MNRLWVVVLVGATAVSCAKKVNEYEPLDSEPPDTSDSEPVLSSDDSENETETEADTDSETDTTPPPGELGDPCWESFLPPGHPNLGLADCVPEYRCIGNNDEAWCSEPCLVVGDTSEAPETEGWCCGDWGGSLCDPSRYWLPTSMAGNHCAPWDIPLGRPCGGDIEARCAPMCEGNEEMFRVTCAATADGRFCTHACETHADCLDDIPFAEGCCGNIMGATYCLPEVSDACLPI